MRIASPGHAAFAAAMVAVGCIGLVKGGFAPIWPPVPKGMPARDALAYACDAVALACGIGLLFERSAAIAARVLLGWLVLWMLAFRVPGIAHAPLSQDPWSGCGEGVVYIAAAWVLYAWFATDDDRQYLGFATADNGLRIARRLYGLALIPFGTAHFAYAKETAGLVPGWLPAHEVWVYATGSAFVAAGVAILSGVASRWAAVLSALQMGGFTLLVWAPMMLRGPNAFQWSEFVISCVLTTAGWVVADSFRVAPPVRAEQGARETQ